MKKALIYLLMALPLVLTTSCLKDQEDTFALPSAQRMQAYLSETQRVLTSSTEGWIFECYPDRNQSYGGYVYTLRFTGDSVIARCELDGNAQEYASLYKMTTDDGPVLSFDTYNEALHYFSTPSSSAYEALDGDLEFIIQDISADENVITLSGKRSGSLSYLRRMPSNFDTKTYIDTIMTVAEAMKFRNFNIIMGEDTLAATVNNRNFIVAVDEETKITTPFVFTPAGMSFYEPMEVFGQKLTGVAFVEGATKYLAEGSTTLIEFESVIPPLNVQFLQGTWYIAYSNLGSYAQGYWNTVQTALTNIGEELYYANLADEEGAFGLNFASYDGSSLYKGSLFFDYELPEGSDDEVTLVFALAGAGDGVWYHNNASFAYALFPFGYSSPRTFKLTSDNDASPSYIILTDEGNPENVIKLVTEEILWPFDQ